MTPAAPRDELLDQQRRLLQAITSQASATPAAGLRGRVDVYRHAFRARLVAALADNHAVLQRAMGDAAFTALGTAYVDHCPSTTPSIRWYGDRLAAFMRSREDLVPHAALVDIARMDWALRKAFDAADAPSIGRDALAGVAPERFDALRFEPHPSVQLLSLDWTVEPAWRALREHDPAAGGDEPELPAPEAHRHTLLVWRKGLETQWRSLTPLAASLMAAAVQGRCFADICAIAAQQLGDPEGAAPATAEALQQWLADGVFSAATPEAAGAQMQRPPSTSIATPVIIDASSLHRKQAALPRSSGVEKRPIGMVARNLARISGVSSPMKVLSSGVSPATGLSATTRMPKGASSTAIERVAVMTQPLLALYQVSRGRGLTPAVDAMLRITPPLPVRCICSLNRGTTSRQAR